MELHSTSATLSEILLEEVQIEFEVDGFNIIAPAKALLYLRPQPNIIFEVSDVPRALKKAVKAGLSQSEAKGSEVRVPVLSGGPTVIELENGTTVNVIPSSLFPMQKDGVLYCRSLPCVALDTGRPLNSIQFSMMNFSRRLRYPLPHLAAPPLANRLLCL